MKKPAVLKDLVMSCEDHSIEHELHPNTRYKIGRDPPAETGYHIIKILQGYNPERHPDRRKEQLALSVSKLQGKMKMDERGSLSYRHESLHSRTFLIRKQERPPTNLVFTELLKFLDYEHELYRGVKEQIFPGDLLVFGNGYVMEYIGHIDKHSEETAERRLRSHETERIVISPELLQKR